ncbi:hypothetical protein BT69DRAFT_416920 [Atractiella rhizophila]|nr:hypothetical protein BT69DRAFT_416920 [Atractiella rhizophila]
MLRFARSMLAFCNGLHVLKASSFECASVLFPFSLGWSRAVVASRGQDTTLDAFATANRHRRVDEREFSKQSKEQLRTTKIKSPQNLSHLLLCRNWIGKNWAPP